MAKVEGSKVEEFHFFKGIYIDMALWGELEKIQKIQRHPMIMMS